VSFHHIDFISWSKPGRNETDKKPARLADGLGRESSLDRSGWTHSSGRFNPSPRGHDAFTPHRLGSPLTHHMASH